jgi:glycosyltransferase involved in cell wall biosynthesis
VEIAHGVELPVFKERRETAANSPMRLIFAGRLDHLSKGVLFLPGIMAACLKRGISAELRIIGDGVDRRKLERRMAELSLTNHVHFLGLLKPAQVMDGLSDSDVMLMPSFREGLPLSMLEAMACGCVPVASRLKGVTDSVVKDAETGFLVQTGHIEGFADAIEKIYRQPGLQQKMGAAARKVAETRFSIEAMGKAYASLFEEALNGRFPLPQSRRSLPRLDQSVFMWRDIVPPVVEPAFLQLGCVLRRLRLVRTQACF